jgi:hypothetical protein
LSRARLKALAPLGMRVLAPEVRASIRGHLSKQVN